jgi:hypothetical protein
MINSAIRVRGCGLTRDLDPSPVSHLTMLADLSLWETIGFTHLENRLFFNGLAERLL